MVKRKRRTRHGENERSQENLPRKKRKKDHRSKNSMQEKTSYKQAPPKKNKLIIQFVLTLLFYMLTISIIIGAALFTVSKDSDKSFFGYRFYTVLTNSMLPRDPDKQKGGFGAGDIIIVQMANPKQLKVNDIITFDLIATDPKNSAVLTHRLIEVLDEEDGEKGLYFRTQGDANTGADRPIAADQVVGKKVFTIPKVGQSIGFLRENLLVSIGALVAMFALVISLRYYFSYSSDNDPLAKHSRAYR